MAVSPELGQQDEPERNGDGRTKLYVKMAISAIVLAASLYIILAQGFPDDYNKWAFGMIGIVVGYWLR